MTYLAVLGHLQPRHGHATTIGGLSGSIPDGVAALLPALRLEKVDCVLGAAHVGALGDDQSTGRHQGLGLVPAHLVLGRARQHDMHVADVDPGTGALDVLVSPAVVTELAQRAAPHLELGNLLHVLGGEGRLFRAGGDERTPRVGERDDEGAELDALESRVLRDVAGSGNGNPLAGEAAAAGVLQHVLDVVDETVARGLFFFFFSGQLLFCTLLLELFFLFFFTHDGTYQVESSYRPS